MKSNLLKIGLFYKKIFKSLGLKQALILVKGYNVDTRKLDIRMVSTSKYLDELISIVLLIKNKMLRTVKGIIVALLFINTGCTSLATKAFDGFGSIYGGTRTCIDKIETKPRGSTIHAIDLIPSFCMDTIFLLVDIPVYLIYDLKSNDSDNQDENNNGCSHKSLQPIAFKGSRPLRFIHSQQ